MALMSVFNIWIIIECLNNTIVIPDIQKPVPIFR